MLRPERLQKIRRHPVFDLTVIGGGATGLGIALDAVLRGFSVLLLESEDFASGTSSRSTKLLHGGVRYLSQGNFKLIKEALRERGNIINLAPHLAQPLSFILPSYTHWEIPFYGLGLKLYDFLAGKHGLGATRFLTPKATVAALPGVRQPGLRGGIQYWDGQFEDARLALALAKTIEREGGLCLNYAKVDEVVSLYGTESQTTPPHPTHSGALAPPRFRLNATDQVGGEGLLIHSRAVINATGVWVDELRPPSSQPPLLSPSQGLHLVVSRDFLPGTNALLVPKTRDKRVLFAVPWLGSVILGTTDTPRQDLPRHPEPFEEELLFILDEASRVLSRPVRRSDIQSMWVGLRPLVANHDPKVVTKSLSREHTIVKDDNGLISITGGKWTTYRVMAEEALTACFAAGVLPHRPAAATAEHQLVGAAAPGATLSLTSAPGLHLYGTEKAAVLACPGQDHFYAPGLTEAMVRFAARDEYAVTVEDVLARRSRLLFLNARLASNIAPEVAAVLQEETGLNPQLEAFRNTARLYQLAD